MEEIGQLLPLLIGLGLLLLLSAFFSGSETALCALSKVQIERLRHEDGKSSTTIVKPSPPMLSLVPSLPS